MAAAKLLVPALSVGNVENSEPRYIPQPLIIPLPEPPPLSGQAPERFSGQAQPHIESRHMEKPLPTKYAGYSIPEWRRFAATC
jgi:hypothetical protein